MRKLPSVRKEKIMGKFGFSFSWKKALGITKAKRKIAKATGIPTTKHGRQKKVGSLIWKW
jgi:hypothetical protein